MPNVASLLERTVRWVRLPERIPALAFSGEYTAVDLILYEVLSLLVDEVNADIGHINLLPKGGRGEKVCTLKDGQPWLTKDIELHLFDPYHGFTGEVMRSGKTTLANDIWQPGTEENPNPFLQIFPDLPLVCYEVCPDLSPQVCELACSHQGEPGKGMR